MERWSGRVALVTGASAGIGAAITKELVLKGMKVVGVARRLDRMEALKAKLKDAPGQLFPLKCDISQEDDILSVFEWIENNLGGVDVLVNNAGIFSRGVSLVDGNSQNWKEIFQTNVLGLSICTREAISSMRRRGVDDGHIIHINSITGHKIINYPAIGMYSASKYGVTALSEALRQELIKLKSHIRVTSISPGICKTEIQIAAGRATTMDSYERFPHLEPEDVAHSVMYALGTPLHVQIVELTIKPVGESF